MATAVRRRTRGLTRRRHPLRRATARLGFWGWLAIALCGYVAYRWLLAHPIVLAMLLCAIVTAIVGLVAWRKHGRAVNRMTPIEFEHHVASLLTRDGCYDVQVIGGAGDLGADVIATTPDGLRVVAQCKQYAKKPVGSPEVQTFGGTARPVHRAHIACMVTTSRFTQPARDYAASMGIQLIDGRALQAWRSGTMPAPWA